MNSAKSILVLLCWLSVSMLLAHWWLGNPEQLPQLPFSVWEKIDKLCQSANAEEIADLEFLVCFSISSLLVGLAFLACVRLSSSCSKKNNQ